VEDGFHILVGDGVKQPKEGCRFPCGADGGRYLLCHHYFWGFLAPARQVFHHCTDT